MTHMRWSARSRRLGTVVISVSVAVKGVLMLALMPASVALASECRLAVIVEGTEPARTAVANELARAGVDAAPSPGCGAETVVVTARGAALNLTITDVYGRVSHRTVADLQVASALIQATPGADVLQPLLPAADIATARPTLQGDDQSTDEVPAVSSVAEPQPAGVLTQSRAPASPAGRGISLLVAPEMAMGSDGSSWAGVSVSGCVMLGPACLGTHVRFWRDLDADKESNGVIHQRATGEIALSLEVPFTWRRIEIRPGAEAGLGWIHMGQFTVHPAADDSDFDQGEVLAGVHIGASYPLRRRWAIEGSIGANIALFAHNRPFTAQGAQLPGEPLAYGIAALGVRYGSP